MAEIPIIAEPGQEGTYPVNLFWHPELDDGRPGYLGTPGLSLEVVVNAGGGAIRGMEQCNGGSLSGYAYIVCGSLVYRYKDGVLTTCSGALLTSTGRVQVVNNGTQVMIIDSAYGYYVTGTTVTRITDADFPIPASLAYQDGYGVIIEKDTGKFWISGLYNFSTWDPLDYTTAEGMPDNSHAIMSDHRELLIFGADSTEPYYNSGASDFPFERISGGFIEKGIGAPQSPAKGDNTVFWFSNLRQVLKATGIGGSPQVVSTRQLDKHFQQMGTVSDAFGFCIDLGGTWYVLTLPAQNETWCFNTLTSRWHQWSSYPYSGTHLRHRANCYCYHAGQHLVGDFENGRIYRVNVGTHVDNGESIRSQVVFPPIEKGGRWLYHSRMEIQCKMGVGLVTGQGSDPMMMIDWTDTAQKTWSNERWRSMGKIGEYGHSNPTITGLGRSVSRQYRATITDPVERQITGLNLSFTVGGY